MYPATKQLDTRVRELVDEVFFLHERLDDVEPERREADAEQRALEPCLTG